LKNPGYAPATGPYVRQPKNTITWLP